MRRDDKRGTRTIENIKYERGEEERAVGGEIETRER